MEPECEGGSEFILLSTAVARMGELHPVYRSRPGYARRDLESAIRAGRSHLSGRPNQAPDGPWISITEPITSRHKLDLHHNALSRQSGPHSYETLFRDVQIEWTAVASHLRAFALNAWSVQPARAQVEEPEVGTNARVRPDRARAERAIAEIYENRIPHQTTERNADLLKKVGDWLKRQGLPNVSDTTILRAAGRRK
jgi:hypothetical protein